MSLLLHCGSTQATREQLAAVPVPPTTDSWAPVPYLQAIEELEHQVQGLGLVKQGEQFGLNRAGDQMFGLLTYRTDRTDNGLTVGLRQSYNKSLALGVAVGAQVFVCDNLCFRGDAFKVIRKNTTNVWRDFRIMVSMQVQESMGHYRNLNQDLDRMRNLPCPQRRGYSYLGVLQGEGLLTPSQATVAFQDWQHPRHPDFEERNAWSLYNCVTEGLKKGGVGTRFHRQAEVHEFFTQAVN